VIPLVKMMQPQLLLNLLQLLVIMLPIDDNDSLFGDVREAVEKARTWNCFIGLMIWRVGEFIHVIHD